MRINFSKLRFKNFLAVGNDWIELNLNQNHSTVIVGINGAGKTTFIDALTFVLYGKAFRNINKPLLVNSINKEQCLVEVEFNIGKTYYLVRRGIKHSIFEIYRNGHLINQDAGAKDYQNVLEKTILRMNFKAFSQVVVLGSKTYVPFMRLAAADRRTVVDDLLDIQTYTAMSVLLKQQSKDLEPVITSLENQVKLHEEKVKLQTKHIEDLTKNNQVKLDKNLQQIKATKSEIDKLQDKIDELNKKSPEPSPHYIFGQKLNELGAIKAKLIHKKDILEREIKFFTNHSQCSTCHQHINEEFKVDEIHKRSAKLMEIGNALQELNEINAEHTKKRDANSLEWLEYNKAQSDIIEKNTLISSYEKWIQNLIKENQALNQGDESWEQAIAQKHVFENDLKEAKKLYAEKIEEYQYIEYAISLLKDNGIKSAIIKQYVPIINNFINKYLSLIEFPVNFSINEQFEEKLYSRFRDEFSYENFSDGEKLRIDLAILYAWRNLAKLKNSIDTNLLIMDEILDSSLDVFGIEDFFKMMQSMEGSNTNMFIISHQGDVLADKFDHIIKFDKRNGFSELVE